MAWRPSCEQAAVLLCSARTRRSALPAPRGGKLYTSLFDDYWHPIRVAAGRPPGWRRDFQAYELKHYAITRMIVKRGRHLHAVGE